MKKANVWKWAHYSTHAKKRRTRKKYQKKLREHFAPHIPPGTRVEIGLIGSPCRSRTPYCVTIDVWETAKVLPAEIEMEVAY
ncbi:hypothetical protein [uncultured Oscillibacter sp.]|jgi:hypothetical protein|uniref:hypothetical protein n=1 Tax=uncultured Oscillibacter sp. TaxID=876091 RepID=UPI00272C81D4|nr:hypothetical protein [uncultured Oscillibacter sp.]